MISNFFKHIHTCIWSVNLSPGVMGFIFLCKVFDYLRFNSLFAQSARAVEYTDCFSAEG